MVACCPLHDDNTLSYSNKRIDVENLPADNPQFWWGKHIASDVIARIRALIKKGPPLRPQYWGALM
jgi:hypothetical protein